MIYIIHFTQGMISRLVSQGNNKDVEIYINGKNFVDAFGKSSWSGTGGARNAIRNRLNSNIWDISMSLNNDFEDDDVREYLTSIVDEIMKKCVGTDPSFPIYLKKYR